MKNYEKYDHHGKDVMVRSDLKGKHREHCLCWDCTRFFPDVPEKNCKIARILYALCCIHGLCTPVWECPLFIGYKRASEIEANRMLGNKAYSGG